MNERLPNYGTSKYCLTIKGGKNDLNNLDVPPEKHILKAHFNVCNNNNHRRRYQLDGDWEWERVGERKWGSDVILFQLKPY